METQPIKAIIVDDEIDGRNIISHLLKELFPSVQLVGCACNVAEATILIKSLQPDILFLDVEMPDGNAFNVLSSCSNWKGQTILITAYDHYAIKAIKASVSDYLLKPVDENEFIDSVNKALKRRMLIEPANPTEMLLDMYRHLMVRKVRVPTLNGFSLIDIDDIVRCEASGNYTVFFFTNRKQITASRKLGEYEDELKGYGFVRIHKKHLVNTNHIIEYNKGKIGGGYVTLTGRDIVEVSTRRKVDFLNLLV